MVVRRICGAVGLLVALLTVFTPLLFSQGVSDAIRISRQGWNFNACSLGMGNAYSTIGYDFSALRMNPATMGFEKGTTYTMSINTNGFLYSSDFHGSQTDFTTTNTTLSQAGFTFPVHLDSMRTAVIGLGYTQSKDFNTGGKYEGSNSGDTSSYDRALKMQEREGRAMSTLATRMRISQQATYDKTRKRPPQTRKPWEKSAPDD